MYSLCNCTLASAAAALWLLRRRGLPAGGGVSTTTSAASWEFWNTAEPSPASAPAVAAGAQGVRRWPPPTSDTSLGRGPKLCGVTNPTPNAHSRARPQASYGGSAWPTRYRVGQAVCELLKMFQLNAIAVGMLNVFVLNVITLMQAQQ